MMGIHTRHAWIAAGLAALFTLLTILPTSVPVARSFARDRLITVNKYCVQLRKKMKLATGKEVNTLDGKSKEEKSMD
ncbi:hypothetical protein X801_02759, partial [Opisthorchis viverrini]